MLDEANHVSASGPVSSVERLFGREKELSLIEEALYAEGRLVIDEFDQITSSEERTKFSSFLKVLGDRGVNIKFVVTGVATFLDGSAYKSVEQLDVGESAEGEIVLGHFVVIISYFCATLVTMKIYSFQHRRR